MLDLTAAGNRGLETLDSVQDAQNSLHVSHMQQDLAAMLTKLKKAEKAMRIVDKYFASNPEPRPAPQAPVLNKKVLVFPTRMRYQPTMSGARPITNTDTRILTASIFPSGNSFLYTKRLVCTVAW
jgi:hypothetical protein